MFLDFKTSYVVYYLQLIRSFLCVILDYKIEKEKKDSYKTPSLSFYYFFCIYHESNVLLLPKEYTATLKLQYVLLVTRVTRTYIYLLRFYTVFFELSLNAPNDKF